MRLLYSVFNNNNTTTTNNNNNHEKLFFELYFKKTKINNRKGIWVVFANPLYSYCTICCDSDANFMVACLKSCI